MPNISLLGTFKLYPLVLYICYTYYPYKLSTIVYNALSDLG